MLLDRTRAAQLGQETVLILQAGRYTAPSGRVVDLTERIGHAVGHTLAYPPGRSARADPLAGASMTVEVVNASTLEAARRLLEEGHRPALLNFASAKNPGGGFLTGARAQEESLARSSGLYACLVNQPMYAYHRAGRDALYSDYVLYSPDVPVFRDDAGNLLEEPYPCAMITAPAVNAKVVLGRDPTRGGEIRAAMRDRIDKVLAVGRAHGHAALVLGAWGCGAFGNDVPVIADLFHEALNGRHRGAFERVVFAVLDGSKDDHFIGPFRRLFAAAG